MNMLSISRTRIDLCFISEVRASSCKITQCAQWLPAFNMQLWHHLRPLSINRFLEKSNLQNFWHEWMCCHTCTIIVRVGFYWFYWAAGAAMGQSPSQSTDGRPNHSKGPSQLLSEQEIFTPLESWMEMNCTCTICKWDLHVESGYKKKLTLRKSKRNSSSKSENSN